MFLIATLLGLSMAMVPATGTCTVGDLPVAPAVASHTAAPAAQSLDDPFVFVKGERRSNCTSGSYHVTLRNSADESRDVRICLEQTDSTWDCGMIYGVDPQETASYWKCANRATGRSWWVSRPSSSSERLPNPPE